jgi:hypothetical protein
MKRIIFILITILFSSCTEKRESIESTSKIDSLKSVAYKYTASYLMGESINNYMKYLNDDSVNIMAESELYQIDYFYNLERNVVRDQRGYESITSEIEGNSLLPKLYVVSILTNMGLHNYTTAFDDEGIIYFLFGFGDSQFDVLLKRNIKRIETIDEANQIIDLYNKLNYILDFYEIKEYEKANDSLAMSMLNLPKIDGDTIEIERLYYGDQISRYVKHTYRITKGLDFDVQQEDLMIKDRD